MAEVTHNNMGQRHVIGELVLRHFNISGPSGSTLTTALGGIVTYWIQPYLDAGGASVITNVVLNRTTGVLTITSTGSMALENIVVLGRTG